MPIFSNGQNTLNEFSVCKVEAGKAILLSQDDDFELLEVPAKLISPASVGSNVRIRVEAAERRVDLTAALNAVRREFGVGSADVAAIREEIGSESFFKVDSVGCNCALLKWRESLRSLLTRIKSVQCSGVELVRLTTRESIPVQDGETISQLRLDLSWTDTVEVALLFRTSIGAFWTRSLTVNRLPIEPGNFSSVSLVTDLPLADARIQKALQRGAKVAHTFSSSACVTAVVCSETSVELMATGEALGIPVVNAEWLELLLTLNRLPADYAEFSVSSAKHH